MRYQTIFLGMIFPILIILLLINNCNGDRVSRDDEDDDEDTTEIVEEDEPADTISEPMDTTEIIRQAEDIGNSGDLKITLLWNFEGDVDLYVKQPNENVIYFKNQYDPSTGGTHDVDNRNGGHGAAENIYWANPPKGKYEVWLHYFKESLETGRAQSGICTVVVFKEGRSTTYQVMMKAIDDLKDIATIYIE